MQPRSIIRYISVQIMLLITIVMLVFIAMINLVYDWASDDSVHYFMSQEAENYIQHERPAESNASIAVYPEYSSLPKAVQKIFENQSWLEEDLYYEYQNGRHLYLLPYYNPSTERLLFILHIYDESLDTAMPGLTISQVTTLLALVLAVLSIGVIYNLGWSVLMPIKALCEWNRQIASKDLKSKNTLQQPDFRFDELNEVAGQIQSSLIEISQRNEKEKQLLRALSHELRTPLAITKASLELINKTESQLTAKLSSKLSKIQRANNNMCATSETLLWLWSDDLAQFDTQSVNLAEVIKQELDNNRYLAADKPLDISLFEQEVKIEANPVLIQILVRNLVRNALQYSAQGKLVIDFQLDTGLTIRNPVAVNTDYANESNDYGYGVGMYLVTTLCRKIGWQCTISQETEQFTVRIDKFVISAKA
ncbi:sensor histidine kinase [Psychromonas ossibalaenae]|uniref:sensor histidine kinase n=1 Tax=Psychromonas ossibalaenae TaxID=444922 RepID=UPI0003772A57|nr:HAMP domain-containing sensor histidine kinase [Psychromonas ossibalaenae]